MKPNPTISRSGIAYHDAGTGSGEVDRRKRFIRSAPFGFKVESLECNVRTGGRWRFVYTGPDGTRYDNRMVFLRVEAPRLIEIEHGSDKDEDPARFHVTVTFDAQSDGKTVLTMRQLHPTKEQRDAKIGFGAVELGYQTLGKLARHLGAT